MYRGFGNTGLVVTNPCGSRDKEVLPKKVFRSTLRDGKKLSRENEGRYFRLKE